MLNALTKLNNNNNMLYITSRMVLLSQGWFQISLRNCFKVQSIYAQGYLDFSL